MPPFSVEGGGLRARPRGTAGVTDSPVGPLQAQRGVSPIASIRIPNFTSWLQEEPNRHAEPPNIRILLLKRRSSMIHNKY